MICLINLTSIPLIPGAFSSEGPNKTRLMNILIQLRKCVNHPYLFDGKQSLSVEAYTRLHKDKSLFYFQKEANVFVQCKIFVSNPAPPGKYHTPVSARINLQISSVRDSATTLFCPHHESRVTSTLLLLIHLHVGLWGLLPHLCWEHLGQGLVVLLENLINKRSFPL